MALGVANKKRRAGWLGLPLGRRDRERPKHLVKDKTKKSHQGTT